MHVHVQYGLYSTVYMCSMDYTALCTCAVSVRGIVLAASLQDTEAEVRHSAAVSLRPLPPCHVSCSKQLQRLCTTATPCMCCNAALFNCLFVVQIMAYVLLYNKEHGLSTCNSAGGCIVLALDNSVVYDSYHSVYNIASIGA